MQHAATAQQDPQFLSLDRRFLQSVLPRHYQQQYHPRCIRLVLSQWSDTSSAYSGSYTMHSSIPSSSTLLFTDQVNRWRIEKTKALISFSTIKTHYCFDRMPRGSASTVWIATKVSINTRIHLHWVWSPPKFPTPNATMDTMPFTLLMAPTTSTSTNTRSFTGTWKVQSNYNGRSSEYCARFSKFPLVCVTF